MRSKRIFCGWVNLITLWLCYMLLLGTVTYNFGIVLGDMSMELGINITSASGGYTGYSLSQALLLPPLGRCAKRYGAKACICAGSFSIAGGCFLMAFAVREII